MQRHVSGRMHAMLLRHRLRSPHDERADCYAGGGDEKSNGQSAGHIPHVQPPCCSRKSTDNTRRRTHLVGKQTTCQYLTENPGRTVRAPVRRAAWGSSDKNNHTPRRESRAIACENSGVPTRTWPGVAHARPRGAKESDREQTRIGTRTVIECVRHLLLDAAYCARIFST